MKRPLRRKRAGFTLIEVMVSLGIMMIGGMAVIALQTQTIRANSYARQVTTATQIAQIWIERLKQDACMWTEEAVPSGTPSAATVLAGTQYLNAIVAEPGRWVSPPATDAPVSRGFDFQGNDTNAGPDSSPFYCTAYRLQWIYFGRTMRSDVRVWWPRAGSNASPTDFMGCGAGGDLDVLNPGGASYNDYHVVYLSTVFQVTQVIR